MRVIRKYGPERIVKLKTIVKWEGKAVRGYVTRYRVELGDIAGLREMVSKWNTWAARHKRIRLRDIIGRKKS